jgi:EAL domain-containing protein (putative c-di-GMP-specific phosphodiesterase class I)
VPTVSAGEIDVREVIRCGAVEIHFQPIASIRCKALIGVEALTRCTAPDGTLIAPDALFAHAA